MTTKAEQSLYSGYTFDQEQAFKQTREKLQIALHTGNRRRNPTRCEACGKGGMRWRSTTRDYLCRDPNCKHSQPAQPRTGYQVQPSEQTVRASTNQR